HPGDDRDRGPPEPAPGQLIAGAVLQPAEQPELLAPRPCQADLVPAAHRAVHGLPLAAPENRGGGAAATASSTAVNCASIGPGHRSRTVSAGTVPSGA